MSWQATISRVDRLGVNVNTVIHYFDDKKNTFDETVTTFTDTPSVQTYLQTKLTALNSIDTSEQDFLSQKVLGATYAIDANSGSLILVSPGQLPTSSINTGG